MRAAETGGRIAETRALIVEHERLCPGGSVQDWLERHTAGVDVLPIDIEGVPQPVLDDYDLVVSLGSVSSVYGDQPWIEPETEILEEADRRGIPVLGICFGAQILARALGGRVFPAELPEIGWSSVDSRDPDLISGGPWFQWHYDTFELPPGALALASNPVGPQAYRCGPHLGVQFHPEVTTEIIDLWIEEYRREPDGVEVDIDDLLGETPSALPVASANTARLLERFIGAAAGQDRG